MHRFEIDSRPWVRWWWLRGPFRESDITGQLQWLSTNGFGGVELAWLCPLWLGLDRAAAEIPEWLGEDFASLLAITKQRCDEFGLGCDFTFGSCWPFGGTCVEPEDASRTLDGLGNQRLGSSWEYPGRGFIVDHLSAGALRNYANNLAPAFARALSGSTSALFCDSWEIGKARLWTDALWAAFEERYGYDLRAVVDFIADDPQVRYDYRKLMGETVVREFYATFTEICHELGARSRVQCHGSPTDLISAYATVDIPESEAILYNPHFSRIAGSAAALADKPIVSCETFTCIYGFPSPGNSLPRRLCRKEQVADLKLLADGLFAQGVNQIVWHGMPYNPASQQGRSEFYASVHVAPDCGFRDELKEFNGYLEFVCQSLKRGNTLSRLAVYLPNEDEIFRGALPDSLRVPGSQDYAEMRYVVLPSETEGYAPLWISAAFLRTSEVCDGELCCGPQRFQALYVDVEWLDYDALEAMVSLAQKGLPVILKRQPKQPGHLPRQGFASLLETLTTAASTELSDTPAQPLLRGERLPWFWARRHESVTRVFLAHPAARELQYPMTYGQSYSEKAETLNIEVDAAGWKRLKLRFEPNQSLLMSIEGKNVSFEQMDYIPLKPQTTIPNC
jgi:hypothetical protein